MSIRTRGSSGAWQPLNKVALLRPFVTGSKGSKALAPRAVNSRCHSARVASRVNEQPQGFLYSRCRSGSMLPCKTRMTWTVSGVTV